MCMTIMMACTAFGQNDVRDLAPLTKRGEMPPAWLRNKLTQAQYDSVARLSKYYAVNYNHFKQRNLTQQDIQRYVKIMGRDLDAETLKRLEPRTDTCMYNISLKAKVAHPFTPATVDNDDYIHYIVYSEIDGYDAHIMLEVKKSQMESGNADVSQMRLAPYSLSGLKVELMYMHIKSLAGNGLKPAAEPATDSTITTTPYQLSGAFCYEDAMGNVHKEFVDRVFFLRDK